MQPRVIERFFEIANGIPRASGDTAAFRAWLVDQGAQLGCTVACDGAGNVLWRRGRARLCVQSHMDMVAVGDIAARAVAVDGWALRPGGTLGADDGAGMAVALALFEDPAFEGEALFTNDEEIGLLGARALALSVAAPMLLNIDGEEEGVVYTGCAGGLEVLARLAHPAQHPTTPIREHRISDLPGGHSGLDIDRGIPNAIVEWARSAGGDAVVVAFEGGERINSIPTHAMGRLALGGGAADRRFIAALATFPQGVLESGADVPEASVNLGLAGRDGEGFWLRAYMRAMSAGAMKRARARVAAHLEGFELAWGEAYAPWAGGGDFAAHVAARMQEVIGHARTQRIHAGLECGVLGERLAGVQMASIGPNIHGAHSVHERMELASLVRTFAVVRALTKGA